MYRLKKLAMERQTYIKKNSHTQKEVRKSIDVVNDILKAAQITQDEWLHLLFEHGCQFTEMSHSSKKLIKAELQDKKNGFWAWWVAFWLKDDATLLKDKHDLRNGGYEHQKTLLLKIIQKDIENEKIQKEVKY